MINNYSLNSTQKIITSFLKILSNYFSKSGPFFSLQNAYIQFNSEIAYDVEILIYPPFSSKRVQSWERTIPHIDTITTAVFTTPPAVLSLKMYSVTWASSSLKTNERLHVFKGRAVTWGTTEPLVHWHRFSSLLKYKSWNFRAVDSGTGCPNLFVNSRAAKVEPLVLAYLPIAARASASYLCCSVFLRFTRGSVVTRTWSFANATDLSLSKDDVQVSSGRISHRSWGSFRLK